MTTSVKCKFTFYKVNLHFMLAVKLSFVLFA